MDILKFKGYEGSAELDMDRGVCRGKILFIDDLVTYEADSPRDLIKEFHEAVEDYIETCKQVGKAPQKSMSGQFNIRIAPALHQAAARRACRDGVSLNAVVSRAMDGYLNINRIVNNISVTFSPTESFRTLAAVADNNQWDSTNVCH